MRVAVDKREAQQTAFGWRQQAKTRGGQPAGINDVGKVVAAGIGYGPAERVVAPDGTGHIGPGASRPQAVEGAASRHHAEPCLARAAAGVKPIRYDRLRGDPAFVALLARVGPQP